MGKTLGYGEITVANMTEPFTVMLTNEAQQFATDSNRKVTSAQSYYTDIIVIRGSQERTDYTIGNITSGSGITVSKNSKRVTFSVSAGTTIGADAGVIEIPITLDGQTVKKQFSWSCGKQGPQGVKGNDGNSFAWNMLSETNCGKKHWGTESSGGKYSVEDFITEDNIDAVKLICTEAISTSNWSFVSFKDIKMLKQLKPSTKYTLSYDIKANRSGAISHSICKGDVSNFCTNTVVVNNIIGNETWQHISVVLTTNDLKTTPTNEILYLGRNALSKVGYSIIKNLKLVEGDIDTPWSPSQSDIEGKGVVETVQYYLATSQASGVTSSTSGWSTDITTQKLTADKKYLWNCYQTKYSDGTSEPISTPKVIGVYGDKGQKGENAKNLSITPSSQYFKSTDGGKTFAPDTIAIKPTIQGEISFGKWQYSIDGGVSFADVVSGQKGLTISNNVLTVNKDSSLYSDAVTMVTFRAVANDSSFYDTCSIAKIYDVSDIGDGRNLIQKSQLNPIDGAELSLDDYTKNGTVIFTNKSENSGFSFDSYNNYQPNSKYVLSYYFTKTSGTMNSFGGSHNGKGVVYTSFFVDDKVYDTASYAGGSSQIGTILNDGKRHRIVVCYTTPDTIATDTSVNYTFIQPGRGNTNPNFGVKIEELKLEKGSSPTGWSPAPEDLQTAILSTKSEISDVSLKVDKNKQAIEQRVEKTTYQQDLNLVKGDISKANEGLNKWRYEIYPKSLFASEYQGKSTMGVFAKNTNLTPSQSVLINDTDFGKSWAYGDNYIGYALTFVKFSAAKSIAITFKHDDGAHLYLNGKLIGGDDTCNIGSGESLTLSFIQGWNCLEVVLNEKSGGEYIGLGTTISAISECQLMNCYYGTPVARQSHITNQLVENTTNIEGVTTTMQKVMTTVGGSDRIDEFVNNYNKTIESEKQFKKTIGETYTTKDDFNGLEIGGRNLLLYSQTIRAHKDYYGVGWLTDEVETFNGCPVWSVKNQWGRLTWLFKSHVIDRGLVKVGDTLTYSLYAKTNNASGKSINCSYRFKGNTNAYWFNGSAFNVGTNWTRYSVTFTITKDMLATDTYMTEIGFEETASMSGDDKVYYACPKLERGTKATDYTPALEDNEINGQNLVSNLSSNWEQGSVSYVANSTYASIKTVLATRLRTEDVFSVSGNVTISAGTSTNSSKEELNFYYVLFDVNKKAIGVPASGSEWQSLTSPKIINCGDAKYMAIILRWGSGSTVITPSNISQICLKIERGTSATPFTLAPEDVNGKIVNVETIANQTANKFEWIVKSGDSSSNFTLTDRVADLVAERINFKGLVTFSGLNTDAKNEIGKVAQSKVDGLEVGGRNLLKHSSMIGEKLVCDNYVGCNNCDTKEYTNEGFHIITPTEGNANNGIAFSFDNFTILGINGGDTITFSCDIKGTSDSHAPFISIHISDNNWYGSDVIQKNTSVSISSSWQRVSVTITTPTGLSKNHMWLAIHGNYQSDLYVRNFKLEKGNKATDWTPAPEDVSQDATNKASQALTDAKNYSSNAVNWVTSNGSSTTSLNSMVKKWTDGAVSDTAQINGGWIKANTITASKIAVGDFTNYADINESNTYGFTVEKTADGVWFSKDGSKLGRDNYISKMYSCEPGQTFYVEYDISNTIKDSTEYKAAGTMLFGCDGTQTVKWYQRRGAVVGTAAGTVTHMSQQLTMPSGTRFFYVVLQIEGHPPFTGTLKIRNLSVRKAVTGAVIVDGSITADKIATDAIKSRNYISSGGTQGSFLNLSDGSFTSPNLSWDSNGNLIAKNANLSGQITATKGKIGSFNLDKSLYLSNNSPYYFSQFCAKKVYGLTNEGDIYIGSEGIYSYSWETGNMYIGDSGSIQADVSSSRGVCIENGEIYIYKSDYCKDYPTACDNKYGLVLAGGYVASANYSDGGSIDGFNFILTPNKFNINGKIYASNELQTGGDQIRIISGNIGCMVRNDSADFYILRTNSGDPYGGWTNDRPFRINWASNDITCGHNLTANDLIANSWVYCSEVHSSGAVVIASNSESYYWAHGYQMARGTSWGGVCIGDNSQGLRLYGTSIWASHSISTSDENLKENFTTLDQYEDFYMNLNPIGFNYIGDYDGKKTHFGFGAHKTEDILESEGYDSDKFAVVTHRPLVQEDIEKRFGKDVEVDIETEYGVSYTEFIALNTHMIQKTRKELEQVKQEKTDLEARLQAIEAKLGL